MMMGFGLIIFLVFAGIVVLVALGLGKVLLSDNKSIANLFNRSKTKTSRDILEERYVKGEISRDEYNEMKKDLY
jgi:putative membrane protein